MLAPCCSVRLVPTLTLAGLLVLVPCCNVALVPALALGPVLPDHPICKVAVAGSFNGWSKDSHVLRDTGEGRYELVVTLPKGPHEYKFVLDGTQWELDPHNPSRQDDGKGNTNSVVGR